MLKKGKYPSNMAVYLKNVLVFSFFIKNELKEKKTCFLDVKKESIEKPIV